MTALDESEQAREFRKSSHDAAYKRAAAIAESLITARLVQGLLERGQPEGADDLEEIKRLRRERIIATKREARLRKGLPDNEDAPTHAPRFKAWLMAGAQLVMARCRLKAAIERVNTLQNDLPNPSSKHVVSQKFAAVRPLIHELFYIHDLSDPTIYRLLRAVDLPTPTQRNIKSLRRAYRRP